MNFRFPHRFTGSIARRCQARAFTAVALVTILFTATSVQAGPVTINQVVQTLTRTQGPVDLRVDTITQDPAGGTKVNGGPKGDAPTAPVAGDAPKVDGVAAAMSLAQDPQNANVEVIEEGEVVGSICDCGDILIADGAFPKWPLLLLSAVPLAFIHHCDTCDDIPPGPTPTPTPPNNQTPTPEPASLLLFGTGLLAAGAGLRRRYAKSKD